jgi:hypothetical protein
MRTRALRLEAAATRPRVLRLFAAVFAELDALFTELFDAVLTELLDALFTELFDVVLTELLDALFTELFDAVLTELFAALLTELLDAVFTELFVADLADTALPRDPRLLTCFDLEDAFAAAAFGLLGVDDLAVFGFAAIGGAAVSTSPGPSIAVISGLCTAASDSPLLVDLDPESPRSPPPPVVVTRAFAAFSGRIKSRLNSAVEVESVQTFAPSFQSMPALPQSALVSGWLEVSKRRGSANSPIDRSARAGAALPSLG